MEKIGTLEETIKNIIRSEVKDKELAELAIKILEAYLKGGRRAVENIVLELVEEVLGHGKGNISRRS